MNQNTYWNDQANLLSLHVSDTQLSLPSSKLQDILKLQEQKIAQSTSDQRQGQVLKI